MKRIIGIGKPRPKPPDISDTIDRVDKKAENMRIKINQCDFDLRQIREQMKKISPGNASIMSTLKEKAKQILLRKKQYESLEGNLQHQSFTMEQATAAIQTATTNQQIVSVMKTTVKEITKAYRKFDLDDIEEIQEKMDDVLEISEEIQEVLGRNFSGVPDIDEDQLEAELEALGNDMIMDPDKSYLDAVTQSPLVHHSTIDPEPSKIGLKAETKQNVNGITVDEFGLPLIEETTSQAKDLWK